MSRSSIKSGLQTGALGLDVVRRSGVFLFRSVCSGVDPLSLCFHWVFSQFPVPRPTSKTFENSGALRYALLFP